jgi:hypothetical protein
MLNDRWLDRVLDGKDSNPSVYFCKTISSDSEDHDIEGANPPCEGVAVTTFTT